jgi:ATP-dependent helicase HrpB
MPDSLPIDVELPAVLAAVRDAGAVILRAPTGAGKTTRVPPALIGEKGLVYLLEPRRVAARAAARRMAAEHDSPLGDRFGYHVRFDRKASKNTRVLAVTPGVLLQHLHADPYLESASCVVFDEFHERGVEADLVLGMVRLIRESVRPELNVVVMSATVDPGPISRYLGDCPVVTSEGRTFPVDVRYRPKRPEQSWPEAAAGVVKQLLPETPGDVLVFLPGLREIRQTADLLTGIDAIVLPLHGDLPPEQQDRALQKLDRRKAVLATNVAETSVTVDGVTAVVDTGVARQVEFDPATGTDQLRIVPIARTNADQRTGRAGRQAPGVCVRLWNEVEHRSRPEQLEPEIRRIDPAGPVLRVLSLGESDPLKFPWLDPPKPDAVAGAMTLLNRLGLVVDGSLTSDGEVATTLPVHPRLARLLLEGPRLGVGRRAAHAAALISERDPFLREDGPPQFAPNRPPTESDLLDRVEALEVFETTGRLDSPVGRLHRGGAETVLHVRDQLLKSVSRDAVTLARRASEGECQSPSLARRANETASRPNDDGLLRSIFAAYPDRLARRRGRNDRRALMVGGRGIRLGNSSGVTEPDLFVCIDVDGAGGDALVRIASGIRREWLPAERIVTRHEVEFDESAGRLVAVKRTRFDDLVIDETQGHFEDESAAAAALAVASATHFDRVAPPEDSPAGQFRTRARCLQVWVPDLGLPPLDDEQLKEQLTELCRGKRSLDDVRNGNWLDALRGLMTYSQLQTVDREAPERIEVPSGSRITLQYEEGQPPVLAARIQELFGLAETPRIAGGRVKVLLHLLAPNYRPQQVTDDLESFWANGYSQVRKELRARYPKHSWPEDPLTAEAVRGPKRRS